MIKKLKRIIPIVTVILISSYITKGQTDSIDKEGKKTKLKPNVIFILADDLGIGNVSAYGADHYQTPNIDKLAKEGIIFKHAYTEPLCGPSRAMILTGRYPFRTGGTNQDACMQMPLSEIYMPKLFKSAGYSTSCIGKWGQLPAGPKEAGFDDYLKFKGSGVYKTTSEKEISYVTNGEEIKLANNEYMPDIMHQQLINVIKNNKEKPFFIYYPMSHVHGKIIPTPDSKPDSKDLFADNVIYMDKLVGKLIDFLDSSKLRENTLIVFMGDNGTGNQWTNNSTIGGRILSGKKGEMKECGSLVPLIVNWKGRISKGITTEQLIDATDFIPTFAEITGVKSPKEKVFDGVSFAGLISGKKSKIRREWIFMELGNDWYVRTNRWKLNRAGNLFDMCNAPFEEKLITEDDQKSKLARIQLTKILEHIAPEKGILDNGTGDGRHANKAKKKQKENTEE